MTELPIIRNQFFDLENKSMDWFLFHRELHYGRVKDELFFILEAPYLTLVKIVIRPSEEK